VVGRLVIGLTGDRVRLNRLVKEEEPFLPTYGKYRNNKWLLYKNNVMNPMTLFHKDHSV
jgi:hypothetical protein